MFTLAVYNVHCALLESAKLCIIVVCVPIYFQNAVKKSARMFENASSMLFLYMDAFENHAWSSAGKKQQEGRVQQS